MDFFSVLTLIGGLALFLYGMDAMGQGLSRLSGGRMERLLERLTSNKIRAVLLGAGVTAVIQSSSATTVMVVGFVNSGIMKLSQTVGIIMGANIGTTVTSWILSLTGLQSSNFFVKLLKPSSFSPVLAVIGVIFLLFSKRDKRKDVGMILIGFAILMTGMETMSGAVSPLSGNETFTGILTMFSNPLLGLLAGAVLTAVIQSSSASVGILQALCSTGAIGYSTAIPIIMGQNIGTCVTAILSSIGTSRNAKRAAAIHLYFNLIGTTLFMTVFYLANAVVHFSFMEGTVSAAGIAVVHTSFNVLSTIVLLPFSELLEKLAVFTIPDRGQKGMEQAAASVVLPDFARLDERFLDKPGFAVEECRGVAANMLKRSGEAMFLAMDLLTEYDSERDDEVARLEDEVDRYEDVLGSYLVRLGSRDLSRRDSRMLSVLLHCIGDFERISDHAVGIAEASREMNGKKLHFSESAEEELAVFSESIRDILNRTAAVFESADMDTAWEVASLEQVIDHLNTEEKRRHIDRLRRGRCTTELGFILSDISTHYESVADHCLNVAVCTLQVGEEGFDLHEYLDTLKRENSEAFETLYRRLKNQYALPERAYSAG